MTALITLRSDNALVYRKKYYSNTFFQKFCLQQKTIFKHDVKYCHVSNPKSFDQKELLMKKKHLKTNVLSRNIL